MISETDIGEYEIIKGSVLGTGAFATVWKGRSKKDPSNHVAIKAIKKKNFLKSQQLLSKEITILKELSSLHHRNVVGLLDCVELKDDVCLVMEYCNGGDLADCLHRNGTLSEDTLCSYVKQIAEAMKALQQKGIVHRDLKPQNILLCYEGIKYPHPSEMLLKIADFGFARFIIGAEMATTLCGSPMYMAPEVIMSVKYSAKADLWSIGTILYQCLTGRAPFQAQNPQELKKKYEKSPGLKPNIPTSTSPELRDLLMRMLKRDAEERISFEEFFKHPFLQLPTQVKVSAPVAVPKRRSSSSPDSIKSGKSPGKSSPSRAKKLASPAPSPKETEVEEMVTTLTEAAGYARVDKEEVKRKSGRSTPEDYVMVPENLCLDAEGDNSVRVRKAPLAEEEEMASFSISPQRSPKHNQGNSTVSLKDKSHHDPAGESPSRPDNLTVGAAKQPHQSEAISVLPGTKSSPDSASMEMRSKLDSQDVRMDSVCHDGTIARPGSEARLSGFDPVDTGSFSPPAVQFCVGTPPNMGSGHSWRRSNVVTPPPTVLSASPHRKLSRSPNDNSPECGHASFAAAVAGTYHPAYHTSSTVPDNMLAMAHQREAFDEVQPRDYHHVKTESSLLSHQLHLQNRQGSVLGFGEGRERTSSVDNDRGKSATIFEPDNSPPPFARRSTGTGTDMSPPPPHHILLAQSPSSGAQNSSPLRFIPQPLSEETLMDDNHNETLGKLSFVLDLVECIIDLARSLGSAFRNVDPVETKKVEHLSPEHYSRYRTSQRSLEQLVLYARACSLLNSALHLARDETRNDRLQQSTNLCSVIMELQTYYHHVVDKCKTIHRDFTHNCKTPLSPKLVMATADKLIYNQAVHMCQTAALDEFSSNNSPDVKSEVVRRYQVAQILFHSLAQTAYNENDKHILEKYLKNVERRLSVLTSDGMPLPPAPAQQAPPLHQHVDNLQYQCST